MKCELVISKGPDAEQRFTLVAGQEFLLGRGEGCDLRLRDPSVSRHQCHIWLEADRVMLSDLSSRWGTLVNDQMFKGGELKSGDRITLGDTEITVLLGSSADDLTLPPRTRPTLDQSPTAEFRRPLPAEVFSDPPDVLVARNTTGEPAGVSPRTEDQRKTGSGTDAARLAKTIIRHTSPATEIPPAIVDRQFGNLKLDEVVAIGRTGIVYSSTNSETGEKYAVKLFYPEALPEGEPRERFVRAMRTMINLRHENLVRLHRAGSQRGVCYTVSEFVEGHSAGQLLAKSNGQGMDWRFVRHIAVGVAHALQFAFEQNIVHRNVTPSNILMNESGSIVKLGDLYLAKALIGANAFDVTRTDGVIGHLPYLSPEQIEHLPGQNHLSDLYSLGATLYALLTGGPPFVSDSPTELLRQITTRVPNPIRTTHPEIPSHFESVVLRLLAKRPEDRLPNPAELLKQLRSDRTD